MGIGALMGGAIDAMMQDNDPGQWGPFDNYCASDALRDVPRVRWSSFDRRARGTTPSPRDGVLTCVGLRPSA